MRLARFRQSSMFPGGTLHWRPVASGRPPVPPRPVTCRGRLGIGYHITADQLRCTVEVACRTETTQALTTLVWAGRLDDFSHQVLSEALGTAARPDNTARIQVFAAAALKLFRHTSKTLSPDPRSRVRRRRAECLAGDQLSNTFGAESGSLFGDLLAAADELRNRAHLRPRVTVTDRSKAERSVNEALFALQGLFGSFGNYLEQALQPLEPHVSREAVRAFILETLCDLDDLAACRPAGNAYVEDLSVITQSVNRPLNFEIEGSFGVSV